jgi:hypothetical protein
VNAYELADKLEWHWDNDCRSPAISKSADMLRQQADRIADYERWEKRWSERVARAENRIAELEKSAEPVAIVKKMMAGGMENFPIERFVRLKEGTLLYTHPAKTLTDEEIWEIAQEQYGHSCGLYGNHIGFARAILKKASEK